MSKQTVFIAKVVSGAQANMRKYGVLASLSIAQAILESGWGASAPGNNLFGIKSNGWSGKAQILTTTEEVSGVTVTIKALFRVYDSWADSIADHGSFIAKNSRYKNIIGVTDYTTVCNYIKADGYATESDYATQLTELIEQYKLNFYDTLPTQLCVDTPVQNSVCNGSVVISGWAQALSGISRVDIYADGKHGLARLALTVDRLDVIESGNPFGWYKKVTKCGFGCTIPAGKLSKGKHSIDFAAIGCDKSILWGHRYITVE